MKKSPVQIALIYFSMHLHFTGTRNTGFPVPVPPLIVPTYCFFTVSSTGERQICHHLSRDLSEAPPALSPNLATASKSHGSRFKGPINRSMLLDFKDAISINFATLSQTRHTANLSHNGNGSSSLRSMILRERAYPLITKIKPFTFLGLMTVWSVNYVLYSASGIYSVLFGIQFGSLFFRKYHSRSYLF